MGLSSGKRPRKIVAAAVVVFVAAIALTFAYMLPGQWPTLLRQPRFAIAVVVACWRFERIPLLTWRQRILTRYTIELTTVADGLQVHFHPRQPNAITYENLDLPRRAWGTRVVVDPSTFVVVKYKLDAD